MGPKTKPQLHMDDNILDNPALEQLLESREELKQGAKDFRAADKAAKDMIRGIEAPTPYRVGRFIVDKGVVEAQTVEFERPEGFKFTIKAVTEE